MGCVFFFCILVVAFVGVVSFSTPRTLGGQGYPSELVGIRERLAGALQRETRSLRVVRGDRVSEIYARGWFELLAASLVPLDLGLKGARTYWKS